LRFVLDPSGIVTPDFSGKLPGRGAWVTATREAIEMAVAKGAFARSFKSTAPAPDGLAAMVEAGIAKAAANALGLARRVGDAAAGFDQARQLLRENKAAALISASDGAEDGKRKLKALAKGAEVFSIFDCRELSAALGRDGVIHVALNRGPAAKRFIREARRLERFRTGAREFDVSADDAPVKS